MKKFCKKIVIIFLVVCSFFRMDVFANENLEIIDIKYGDWTGILYSDRRLLLWNQNKEKTIENVKKFNFMRYSSDCLYLTYDDVLHVGSKEYINISDFVSDDESGVYAYKDKENNLYVKGEDVNYNFIDKETSLLAVDVDKIFLVVDHFNVTLMYTTNNHDLYAVGRNYFGTKLNDGNDFVTPYKILDDVKDFGKSYALKNNGDLYTFDYCHDLSSFPSPYLQEKEVESVIYEDANYFHWEVIVREKNGIEKTIYNKTVFDSTVNAFREKVIDVGGKVKQASGMNCILMDDNKLYYRDDYNKKFVLIDTGIKEVASYENASILALNENGELYFYGDYGGDAYYFASALLHQENLRKKVKLLENVDTLKYVFTNGSADSGIANILLLKNGGVLRYGSNNSNQFKDNSLVDSYIPVQIDELINNGKEIKSSQIVLSTVGNKNLMIGHSYDFYASVIPFNAVDRAVEWTSSDSSVVSVDNTGYVTAINEGKAKVCATLKSNKNISSCEEVKVNPKVTKVEITDGDTRVVYPNAKVLLTANTYPKEALDVPVTWTSDDNVKFFNYYTNSEGFYIEVEKNQIVAMVPANGNYVVQASVDDVNDTITLTTEDKVNDINVYLNDKLYKEEMNVYLDQESLQLRLDTVPVGSSIYSLSITNDNYDIITIDGINRIIHLNDTGRVTLTIYANNIIKEITLNILESRPIIKGDLDKNGSIEIYDVMELLYIVSGKKEKTSESIEIGDMDKNGDIDIFDVMELLYIYTGKK